MSSKKHQPEHIKLSSEQQDQVIRSLRAYYADQFDEELSYFKAKGLLEFFVRELGAPVYNQAIQDARAFIEDKLIDLEAILHEPESPYSP